MTLMENRKAKSYETSYGAFTITSETVSQKFDTASFKEAQPDLYEKYLKESKVKPSLIIKLE